MKRFFAPVMLAVALIMPLSTHAQSATTSTTTPPVPKPQCILVGNTSVVNVGGTVNLSWSSANATNGTITSIGSVGPNGLQGVIPLPPATTYVGTFYGPGGTTTCAFTATVSGGGGGGTGAWTGGYQSNGTYDGVSPYSADGTYVGPKPTDTSLPPIPTQAIGALVPCGGLDCQFCSLASLSQKIINFLVGLSIPIAVVLLTWAGFIYFTSALNPGQIEKAKKIFKAGAIGFVIAITAWLVIQTILKVILADSYYKKWNVIECVSNRHYNTSINELINSIPALSYVPPAQSVGITSGPSSFDERFGPPTPPDGGYCDAFGTCFDRNNIPVAGGGYDSIAAAAQAYYNTDTSMGPDGGNLACAWAVNNVLQSMGIDPIDGNSVTEMVYQLDSGRGTEVTQANAQPGDIIAFGGISHVGICMNAGCTQVLSNSSGSARFINTMGPTPGSVFFHVNR